eukprot:TRINITY_DN90329_c0_g1_i1.p1 TRINITY_DN90329_c0_g1~~TRINITY_DN90329_c0_g1_i1.p1  ORF type:complete len:198 (-),score=27.53 TRINITY_DN90329_c0_g1_i1:136-729(-)
MGADPLNDGDLRRKKMEHFARLFAAKGETTEAPADSRSHDRFSGKVHEPPRPAVSKAGIMARVVGRPADERQNEASGSIFSLLPPPAMVTEASDSCESFSQSTFICPRAFKTLLLQEKARQACEMPVRISFVCHPQIVQTRSQSSSPNRSPEFSPVAFAESLRSEVDAVLGHGSSMYSVEGGPILQLLRAANGRQSF